MVSTFLVPLAAAIVLGMSTSPPDETVGPAPGPPPTVERDGVCDLYGIGVYKTHLSAPERVSEGSGPTADGPLRGNGVHASGYVDVSGNTACSQAKVKFQLETKVCNRWGHLCSWRTIRDGEWRTLPESGRVEESLTGECRSGVDTYKLTAVVSHVEMSFEQAPSGRWVPYLETKSKPFHSDEVKIDCG